MVLKKVKNWCFLVIYGGEKAEISESGGMLGGVATPLWVDK